MKRQTAIIASAIFAFALVAVLIAADKIPLGVVTVVNGTGGGNLTVSGTGGTDQLLTWDTDTTGHWTSGISSFGVTNLAVLSSMSINITNQVLTTDGSGNVVGGGDPFVWTSRLADNATNVAMVVDTAVPWSQSAGQTPVLAEFRNNGTNQVTITPRGRLYARDQVTSPFFLATEDETDQTDINISSSGRVQLYDQAITRVGQPSTIWRYIDLYLDDTSGYFEMKDNDYGQLVEIDPYGLNADSPFRFSSGPVISSGLLFEVANQLTNVFTVSYDGSTFSASTNFANYVYVTNDCSALTFTDRSRSPSSLSDAYRIVQSHATKNGQVDHDKLDKLAQGRTKDTRDLGMVISAQEMVIQDLLARIEKLEKK